MIKIICVGKIKEKFYTDAVNEYLKRLSKYTKIDLIEVKDENFDDVKTLIKERDSILKYINDKDYIITLEIDGNELDSVSLSNHISSVEAKYSNITFIWKSI